MHQLAGASLPFWGRRPQKGIALRALSGPGGLLAFGKAKGSARKGALRAPFRAGIRATPEGGSPT